MFYQNPLIYNKKESALFHITPEKLIVSNLMITPKGCYDNDNFFKLVNKNTFAFIDATALDNLDNIKRFSLVHNFFSYKYNTRLLVRQFLSYRDNAVTLSHIFFAANAVEREIYDMYGISFTGHPDLRRILTDYSFTGHPLKKDYPLTGYIEIQYSLIKKSLTFNSLSLAQEYRQLSLISPWNNL